MGSLNHEAYERLVATRHKLDREGPRLIGDAYACSVITPGPKPDRRLLLHVTSRDAIPRARAVLGSMPGTEGALVRVSSPRLRATLMRRVFKEVVESMPTDEAPSGIGFESSIGRSSCPRIHIELAYHEVTTEAIERWARETVERYGADRILVTRGVHPIVS